jgi:hypothetical protein
MDIALVGPWMVCFIGSPGVDERPARLGRSGQLGAVYQYFSPRLSLAQTYIACQVRSINVNNNI